MYSIEGLAGKQAIDELTVDIINPEAFVGTAPPVLESSPECDTYDIFYTESASWEWVFSDADSAGKLKEEVFVDT